MSLPKTATLSRVQATAYLQNMNVKVTSFSLAALASKRRGPRFYLLGQRSFYDPQDLRDWASSPDANFATRSVPRPKNPVFRIFEPINAKQS